jgi:AcrR family transcriptional regulator
MVSLDPEWFTSIADGADRRQRRRARRIGEILATTAEVIGEQGYNNTSLDEIAERLDLAKASIYHYFDSKESLVLMMLTSCHEFVVARLTLIAEGPGTADERLRRLIAEQIKLSTSEIPQFIQLFLHPMGWPAPLSDSVRRFREENDDVYRKVIEQGVAGGEFRLAKPSVSRLCMQGALAFLPDWFKSSDASATETVVDTIMMMFTSDLG